MEFDHQKCFKMLDCYLQKISDSIAGAITSEIIRIYVQRDAKSTYEAPLIQEIRLDMHGCRLNIPCLPTLTSLI